MTSEIDLEAVVNQSRDLPGFGGVVRRIEVFRQIAADHALPELRSRIVDHLEGARRFKAARARG